MFIFAHIGITLGATIVVSGIIDACRRPNEKPAPGQLHSIQDRSEEKKEFSQIIGLKSLANFMDIRLLILGSMFPDIIDKPLSFFGFGDGRFLTHTLLITAIILLAALIIFLFRRKTWLLAIAVGMLAHLVLDSMWTTPNTLIWPLYGWTFPAPDHRTGLNQLSIWWNTLMTHPEVDIFEAVGLAITLVFTGTLLYKRKFEAFVIRGKI
jgi:inner membrane protein